MIKIIISFRYGVTARHDIPLLLTLSTSARFVNTKRVCMHKHMPVLYLERLVAMATLSWEARYWPAIRNSKIKKQTGIGQADCPSNFLYAEVVALDHHSCIKFDVVHNTNHIFICVLNDYQTQRCIACHVFR